MSICFDLIVVSKSVTEPIIEMTQRCIDSVLAETDCHIVVVETGDFPINYHGMNKVIMYDGEFNYNRALNMGLEHAKGDVHILANNDIWFYPGWSGIGKDMIGEGFDSGSVLSNYYRHEKISQGNYILPGYEVGLHLTGWCIFVTKKCIEAIGRLDETFDFWYSDNVYSDQIKEAGIQHGLFCNYRVDHIVSATLSTLNNRQQAKYTIKERWNYRHYAERKKLNKTDPKDL